LDGIIKLTPQERADVLAAIEVARSRLDEIDTEEDAIRIFKETVAPALWRLLKNHKAERHLS
jgi:hypothetical protein